MLVCQRRKLERVKAVFNLSYYIWQKRKKRKRRTIAEERLKKQARGWTTRPCLESFALLARAKTTAPTWPTWRPARAWSRTPRTVLIPVEYFPRTTTMMETIHQPLSRFGLSFAFFQVPWIGKFYFKAVRETPRNSASYTGNSTITCTSKCIIASKVGAVSAPILCVCTNIWICISTITGTYRLCHYIFR